MCEDYKTLTFEDLANGICQVDTANWRTMEVLKSRIQKGLVIAKEVEENGGGNALVVSHSWTIQTLVCLIEEENQISILFQTVMLPLCRIWRWRVTVKGVGDSSYREVGENLQES